jgi:methionine synthase I (cobalamin-dependent)
MTTPEERGLALAEILEQRVLVLDGGAMGTMLQQQHLTAADFGVPPAISLDPKTRTILNSQPGAEARRANLHFRACFTVPNRQ